MKTKTTVRQRILNLLRKASKPLDAKTIARRGKMNYNTVRKELGWLYRVYVEGGFYSTVRVADKNSTEGRHLRHYAVGEYC